ncbi:MAG: Na+/H+ antiporter NhaA [Rikenellaceae bacterium]
MFLHLSKFAWVRHSYSAKQRTLEFTRKPWAGGVVLLLCVILAMIFANMEWSAEAYHALLTTDLKMLIQSHDGTIDILFPRDMNVERLVNDALMVLFFFLVGLEIKREVQHGELSSPKNAILPVLAALGGMVVPALIYAVVNGGTASEVGWGIPMATDIAFAIGILSMLGDRVPVSLKIFLTALAIADDLGAIIVIALFYGGSIDLVYLSLAVVAMVFVYFLNRLGERHMFHYVIMAIIVWTLFYYSGIHATMAGVAMALLIPTTPRYSKQTFLRQADLLEQSIVDAAHEGGEHSDGHYHEQLRKMAGLTRNSIPMNAQLEEVLSPYVTFIVMPIFALVNGGVKIDAEHLDIFKYTAEMGSIGMGVFLGLVVGKPLGIFLMSWLAVKSKLAVKPSGATWKMLFAVACLGGIGFTMSIFVDTLAFGSGNEEFVNMGKIAILAGSLTAAVVGVVLILFCAKSEDSVKQDKIEESNAA